MADLAHSPTLAAVPSQAGERLAPGTVIGEYEITGFLGAGAMGEVYAGKHPVIGKLVAVKLLRAELAASAEAAERFIREARAANAIDHANVIDVFAFGRFGDRLYLVMDLVEGRSLRAVIADGPVPLSRAIEILAPVADALDAGHARGVVHRDLKPDNIMLADSGKVLVLDFGIAKLLAGDGAAPGVLTGQGTWLGTPGYMAPEQWSADGAGPASDRYALGMIAYELLAGALPFTATSVPAMMEQHFRADVPPLGSPADPVLAKMLAKDPEARHATARAFVEALRGTPAPRRAWLPAVAGASVLGLGVVAIVLARGGHDDPHPAVTPEPPPVVHEPSVPPGSVRSPDGRILEVSQFQGVWQLPDGQLRAFERSGSQVDIYKLDEVAGPRAFYKHYPFVSVDHGVAFASDDVVVDHRASDAACSQPVHLEYRYDPATDALELHRPVVTIDIVDGHCVPRSRTVAIEALARVDQAHDALDFGAPRGTPVIVPKKRPPPRKQPPPLPSSAASNAPNAPSAQQNAPPSQILQPQGTVPIQQQGPVDLQKK
ncbi:MAG: serine/threonine protein kinase [Deltaproteobacteria bacterium]|nr:serine/threonine protein kinase [Deltaproteobacteria bacterium]